MIALWFLYFKSANDCLVRLLAFLTDMSVPDNSNEFEIGRYFSTVRRMV